MARASQRDGGVGGLGDLAVAEGRGAPEQHEGRGRRGARHVDVDRGERVGEARGRGAGRLELAVAARERLPLAHVAAGAPGGHEVGLGPADLRHADRRAELAQDGPCRRDDDEPLGLAREPGQLAAGRRGQLARAGHEDRGVAVHPRPGQLGLAAHDVDPHTLLLQHPGHRLRAGGRRVARVEGRGGGGAGSCGDEQQPDEHDGDGQPGPQQPAPAPGPASAGLRCGSRSGDVCSAVSGAGSAADRDHRSRLTTPPRSSRPTARRARCCARVVGGRRAGRARVGTS